MRTTVGVLASEHVAVGLVQNNRVVGSIRVCPEPGQEEVMLRLPAEGIADLIREQVELIIRDHPVEAIGVGFPGIIRDGVIEESPNLHQTKGFDLQVALASAFSKDGGPMPVLVSNDADAMATGIAATRGELDKLIRVWTLGRGIGFGRYPSHGPGEGGHTVVTLDPKEKFCGCGGVGHLEGIMGHRAMRLRFLDMEPEEIFANAKAGDARCSDFVKMWHRALAAATSTRIHMEGPGRFFISGPNARFLDPGLIFLYVREMVTMSPLQGSTFEIVPTSDETAIIGAAVNAEHAAFGSS